MTIPDDLYEDLLEYFDDRMDITWSGGPNDAMAFHTRLTDAARTVCYAGPERDNKCAHTDYLRGVTGNQATNRLQVRDCTLDAGHSGDHLYGPWHRI